MPSPFDITTASNTVNLDSKREGVVLFTVKNVTRRRLHASARVTITPEGGAQWGMILAPDGKTTETRSVRDFALDETQSYLVKVTVPVNAAPGSYTLGLIVADEVNPDENFTVSPSVVFTVLPPPPPPPDRRLPIILAVILVLLALGVIIAIALKNANDSANATATANAETTLTLARQTADAQTQSALGTQDLLGTQNAVNTQNAARTQNAINTQNAVRTQNAINTQSAVNTQNAVRTQQAAQRATQTEAVHLTRTALVERLTDIAPCLLPNCP